MTTDRDPRTRIVLSWLREEAHENADRVLQRALDEVDTTPQRRSSWPAWRTNRMNALAKMVAAAAAVMAVAVVGYPFLAGTATPPPSPVLIVRGSLVERDWGMVELEATRQGATVSGRMTIGEGRGAGWPLTVDLECTRTTDDGVILIGGTVTDGQDLSFDRETPLAGIALKPGSPVGAVVWQGGLMEVPATWTTDCAAYLDAWSNARRRLLGANWIPDSREATLEFGP
ncbi:MAG TPA: hypothetical protein VGK16_13515 [Candidatus Limnocylindrales bacterium]|jgi:hypothetical protein